MPQHENEARARAELMFKVREFQKADARTLLLGHC